MPDIIPDDIYTSKQFDINKLNDSGGVGKITERDKFVAAKQILLAISILYVLTLAVYLINPNEGSKLLDISTITFPPLVTLILAAYFQQKNT